MNQDDCQHAVASHIRSRGKSADITPAIQRLRLEIAPAVSEFTFGDYAPGRKRHATADRRLMKDFLLFCIKCTAGFWPMTVLGVLIAFEMARTSFWMPDHQSSSSPPHLHPAGCWEGEKSA
ncbi:hypothetical protein FHT72_006970 [Rhizobium sp. BK077]|uniref:hypothetical protein n=1 Tax=unclassified Rhizobium TaxID=2613769 RepID=UPI00161AF025|nr:MULTISPECIES: hypothetical protein [unclassified Rhizobium]MBB3303306.1 hypothetical protein [Rhizobium sp. BK112]MBB3372431.1 hypothetical protein [Rhizobium sp. BK077]MBB4183164.1 hypothetical protein [Rhizobium sp. BK109]